jgi:hypothetical protein
VPWQRGNPEHEGLETLDDYSKSGNVDAYHHSKSVATMKYDGTGKFLGAEVLPPERTVEFARFRDAALAPAEPFTEWWAKYGA